MPCSSPSATCASTPGSDNGDGTFKLSKDWFDWDVDLKNNVVISFKDDTCEMACKFVMDDGFMMMNESETFTIDLKGLSPDSISSELDEHVDEWSRMSEDGVSGSIRAKR